MKIKINGKVKEFNKGLSFGEIAKNEKIKNVLAVKVGEDFFDLSEKISKDCEIKFLTFADSEGKEIFWHSSAHILANAVEKLFPKAKNTIGPSIENGFYYDFDDLELTPDDFSRIETEFKKIVEKDYFFEKKELSLSDVKKIFPKNKYKIELAEEFTKEGQKLTAYKHGDFIDLCKGPHIQSVGLIKAFKLMKISGAYWRGNIENKQLTRIYGISFPSEKELKQYIFKLQEAEKRDHKKIGRALDLFSFHEDASGMPFFHDKGTHIFDKLKEYMLEEIKKLNYEVTKTPIILNKELWLKSGHWNHYKDNMYMTNVDKREYALKPMNCPGNMLIFKTKTHSYRDLPIKAAEFGLVHRHELSGVLNGLFRVRAFTQDDAHIFCTEEQLQNQIIELIDLVDRVYSNFGFDFEVELSTKPENSMGDKKIWDLAEKNLADALEKKKRKYKINKGDGAFYGPKIDFHIKDAIGRKWQCGTIQLDFLMPEKFDLSYEGKDGKKHRPIMLHRTIYGSLERFIGILIEHYAGKFPLWISPEQIRILIVSDAFIKTAEKLKKTFEKEGFLVSVDARSESIGKKVREAQLAQVNYILVYGEKEETTGKLMVRTRSNEVINDVSISEFIKNLKEEIRLKK
jgi:threonyl-tRNA synthetase